MHAGSGGGLRQARDIPTVAFTLFAVQRMRESCSCACVERADATQVTDEKEKEKREGPFQVLCRQTTFCQREHICL